MTENEGDLLQLRESPGDVAIRYQPLIRLLVHRCIQAGTLPTSEMGDFTQAITEQLLLRLPSLASHYNGSACVVTYLSAAIRNICLTLLSRRARRPRVLTLSDEYGKDEIAPLDDLLISDEVAALGAILDQYHRQRPRLVLGLKLYFRHPITRDDVLGWFPRCPGEDLELLLGVFGRDYDHLEEQEVFGILSPIAALAMGRGNHPDSFRRWVSQKVDEIIHLLNGEPPVSSHDRETVKLLADRFFSSNQGNVRVYTRGGETGQSMEGI